MKTTSDKSSEDPVGQYLKESEVVIKGLLQEIDDALGGHGFLCLVYNPLEGGGEIIEGDVENIFSFINGLKENQTTILLDGPGGNVEEGLNITRCIRNKFSTMRSIVSGVCGSALCFPILKSDKLIVLKGASITQIDPIFEHEGEPIRAVEHLRDKDGDVKDKANRVFKEVRDKVFDMLWEKPSLLNDCGTEFEHCHKDFIVDEMMTQEKHEDEVKDIAFEYLPLKVEFRSDDNLKNICNELIKRLRQYLIVTGRRYSIASSTLTVLNEHKSSKKESGHMLFVP